MSSISAPFPLFLHHCPYFIYNKSNFMNLSGQAFPTDLLLRTPRIKANPSHKISADYKPRSYTQRVKERNLSVSSKTETEVFYPPASKSKHIIAQTFRNKAEYDQFAERCLSFLEKKNTPRHSRKEHHHNETLNTMFKNIREELKLSERKSRGKEEEREAREREGDLGNEGFLVMRSQLHQQMYRSEDKMEFYRMSRNNDLSTDQYMKRMSQYKQKEKEKEQGRREREVDKTKREIDKTKRYVLNPFDNVSMSCCSASLNPLTEQESPTSPPMTKHSSTQSKVTRRVISVAKPSYSRSMSFHLSGDQDTNYVKKLKSFLDFIFKMNFSNRLYVDLSLLKPEEPMVKYKMYIGKGNNSVLVKTILKHRFWWEVTNSEVGADFYWSQNKIDRLHSKQARADRQLEKGEIKQSKKSKGMEEIYELNRKIMGAEQSMAVEKFILPEGFGLPFEETFRPDIMTNHLQNNHCLGSKKNLFKSLLYYHRNITGLDPFSYMPKTYHIRSLEDVEYLRFMEENQKQSSKLWIVKPGEHTNRGKSINVTPYSNISSFLPKAKHLNGQPLTYIVQDYLSRPLLYNNRKFDIRHFMLVTSINGQIKGYWYKDGYIRTSSHQFDLSTDNMLVHLTNDAIQKRGEAYEKYEAGNKLSYSQFQRYLDFQYPRQVNFEKDILGKMRDIGADLLMANYLLLDEKRLRNNFELLGLDFMIDREFKPWLIEANYNPCLEVNCTVLERIIPALLENTFRIGLDPLFPPTSHYPPNQRYHLVDNYLKHCKYELIFDEAALKEPVVNEYPFEEDCNEELEEYPEEVGEK